MFPEGGIWSTHRVREGTHSDTAEAQMLLSDTENTSFNPSLHSNSRFSPVVTISLQKRSAVMLVVSVWTGSWCCTASLWLQQWWRSVLGCCFDSYRDHFFLLHFAECIKQAQVRMLYSYRRCDWMSSMTSTTKSSSLPSACVCTWAAGILCVYRICHLSFFSFTRFENTMCVLEQEPVPPSPQGSLSQHTKYCTLLLCFCHNISTCQKSAGVWLWLLWKRQ